MGSPTAVMTTNVAATDGRLGRRAFRYRPKRSRWRTSALKGAPGGAPSIASGPSSRRIAHLDPKARTQYSGLRLVRRHPWRADVALRRACARGVPLSVRRRDAQLTAVNPSTLAIARRKRTLQGERACHPVNLAGHVVIDVLKAERGEPARGSWAHVSEPIPAVHDDGLGAVELRGVVRIERLERDAGRCGQV